MARIFRLWPLQREKRTIPMVRVGTPCCCKLLLTITWGKFDLFSIVETCQMHVQSLSCFVPLVFSKCIDRSLGKIRQLSGATQACSQSPKNLRIIITSAETASKNRQIVEMIIASHTDIAYHVEQSWRHAAAPRFQSIDLCWVYVQ